MKDFIRTRFSAFQYAFDGWWYLIRTQRNAWIHAVFSLAAVALGLWLHIATPDWVAIVIVITLVWLAEFLNTALEAVVDLASPEPSHRARVGQAVGAAAAPLAAGASIIVGLLVLGPPLWEKIAAWFR